MLVSRCRGTTWLHNAVQLPVLRVIILRVPEVVYSSANIIILLLYSSNTWCSCEWRTKITSL